MISVNTLSIFLAWFVHSFYFCIITHPPKKKKRYSGLSLSYIMLAIDLFTMECIIPRTQKGGSPQQRAPLACLTDMYALGSLVLVPLTSKLEFLVDSGRPKSRPGNFNETSYIRVFKGFSATGAWTPSVCSLLRSLPNDSHFYVKCESKQKNTQQNMTISGLFLVNSRVAADFPYTSQTNLIQYKD